MKRIRVVVLVLAACFLMGCGSKTKKGVEFLAEEKYEEALTAFEEGIRKDKNPAEAYRGMGITYYEMEKYEEASEAFENALKNEAEETGTIYNFLGICSMKTKDYERALEFFEKGIEMEDCSGELLREMQFNVVIAYEKLGDWENAKIKVKDYITQYPGDAKAAKEAEFLETR